MAFGRKSSASTTPQLNQVQVQTSAYGVAMPVGWGTFRVSPNLLWYGAFNAIQHVSTSSAGGKGGGGGNVTTSYTYTASVILALHLGQIDGVSTIWRDTSVYTDGGQTALAQAGLSLATGTLGQAVWGYLTTNFAAQARGYSDLAYLYAQDYALSSQATLSNHSAEVYRMRASLPAGGTSPDANPASIVPDLLTSAVYGVPGWPSGAVASLTDYGNYCFAAGILLSPLLDSQRSARDLLTEMLQASNSNAVWSDGQLKIIPYGDTQITGNGVTWTPNLTAAYDLNGDAFLPPSEGEEPVKRQIKRPADCYNSLQIEFLDRAHGYNTSVTPYKDQGQIDQYGEVKNPSPISLHSVKTQPVADAVGPLILQRNCYVRRTFTFTLPWNYGLLDPMDLLTLTWGNLNGQAVRISEIHEQQDGDLEITCEEMLVGVHHAPVYARAEPSGYSPNDSTPPGSISNALFYSPPGSLTNGDLEVWVGVGSTNAAWGGCEMWVSLDNAAYERFATINGGARFGTLTGTLASHADPDTTGSVGVDLSTSKGALIAATPAQADGFATLAVIEGELVAYRDATLTSTNHYTLTYFRRGLYGTKPAAHTAGAEFLRLDQAVFKYPFTKDRIGQTVYFKFLSFNTHGQAKQALSDATAYSVLLGAVISIPGASDWAITGSSYVGAGQLPAIIIEGQVLDLNASTILVDYKERLTVGPPATYGPVATKSFPAESTRMVLEGVKDDAWYDVQIRYKSVQGVVSSAVDLGLVQVGDIKITNQGLLALLSAIEDAQLAAGVGVNCLVDTDFYQQFTYYGTKTTSGRHVTATHGVHTPGILPFIGCNWVDQAVGDSIAVDTSGQLDSLPVSVSERVEISAQCAGNNVNPLQLLAVYYDASGTEIGTQLIQQQTSSILGGGGNASTYTRQGGFLTIPSSPSGIARVGLRMLGTVTSAISSTGIRMSQPMVAKARSGSTSLTPYNPGFRGDPNADVTGSHTALGVVGQGPWATESTPVASVTSPNPNLLANGDFRLDTRGWTLATGVAYFHDADGNYVQSSGTSAFATSDYAPIKASQAVTASFDCYVNSGVTGEVQIEWLKSDKSASLVNHWSAVGSFSSPAATWTRISLTQSSPSDAAYCRVWFWSSVNGNYAYARQMKVEMGSLATQASFTGTNTGGALYDDRSHIETLKPSEAGANVTASHTAASISGQGALATKGSVDLSTADVTNKTAGNITYTGGASVDSLKPGQAGADVTSSHTAAAITGQGALATKGNVDLSTTDVTNKTAGNITYTGGATVDSLKPGQVGADVTGSNTAAAISGQGALATKGSVDPSNGDVGPKGSTPPNAVSSTFSYTSTTSSVTISWSGVVIHRNTGATLGISSGNQGVTSLSSGTTYKFYPYMAESASGTMAWASGGTGVGSPAMAYPSTGDGGAAGTVALNANVSLNSFNAATTSSGTGGGSGLGGSGCLHPAQELETRRGWIPADDLQLGDEVRAPDGWGAVRWLYREIRGEWHVVTFNDGSSVKVTDDHRFLPANRKGEVRAKELRLGSLLASAGDHLQVVGLSLLSEPGEMVRLELDEPHLYFLGAAAVLSHNYKP